MSRNTQSLVYQKVATVVKIQGSLFRVQSSWIWIHNRRQCMLSTPFIYSHLHTEEVRIIVYKIIYDYQIRLLDSYKSDCSQEYLSRWFIYLLEVWHRFYHRYQGPVDRFLLFHHAGGGVRYLFS